jgi:hypothetical protein
MSFELQEKRHINTEVMLKLNLQELHLMIISLENRITMQQTIIGQRIENKSESENLAMIGIVQHEMYENLALKNKLECDWQKYLWSNN